MVSKESGEQRVQVLVPNEQGLHCTTQFLIQEYLNLVDLKGLELSSTLLNRENVQSECQEIRTLPRRCGQSGLN